MILMPIEEIQFDHFQQISQVDMAAVDATENGWHAGLIVEPFHDASGLGLRIRPIH